MTPEQYESLPLCDVLQLTDAELVERLPHWERKARAGGTRYDEVILRLLMYIDELRSRWDGHDCRPRDGGDL